MASALGRAPRAGGSGRAPRIGVWCCAMRIWVLCSAIFGAALSVQADWIYWTLNFDEPQSEADTEKADFPVDNPTGNNKAYVWMMMADYTGDTPTYTRVGAIQQLTGEEGEGGHLSGDVPWRIYEINIDTSQYDDADFRFFVEIGNTSGNPDYHSATWYTLSELQTAGYVKPTIGTLAQPWNPAADGWVAPEPSSGLLLLMGGALLALRRRRRI